MEILTKIKAEIERLKSKAFSSNAEEKVIEGAVAALDVINRFLNSLDGSSEKPNTQGLDDAAITKKEFTERIDA